jgi:hypothetical protein
MATVYLPVEPVTGMTSAERAEAINAEVWSLVRPDSVKSGSDVTRFYYGTITHPTTDQVAIIGETTEQIPVHNDVDLTNLIALMPEVPQAEKDQLVAYIDANRGGTVPFAALIPSSSEQLTEAEADAAGWIPADEV